MDENSKIWSVLVYRKGQEPKELVSGLSKSEAKAVKEDWELTVFNSDVYMDPVPTLQISVSSK